MSRNVLVFLIAFGVVGTLYAAAVPVQDSAIAPPESNGPNGRIVGGQQTTISKYPYQVSVRLDTYILLHICGGSIYAPRVVVTAAHCIKGRFASYIRIVAGRTSIADPLDEGVPVSKLIHHSGYNKNTHENDVGLIILSQPLVYSSEVQPIALARSYLPAGTHATITGWGKNDEEAATLTNLLQEADVEIVDSHACSAKYVAKNYAITEQMICAGAEAGGKDTCQGDSGGPLAVDGQLLGIVSWGIGCARSDYPGVYAAIPFHSTWIMDNARQYM